MNDFFRRHPRMALEAPRVLQGDET